MAVRLETTIKRWIGTASDSKPTPGGTLFDPITNTSTPVLAADVPPGSSFLETDTGRIYRWTGSDWTVFVPEEEQSEYLQAILFELASIKEAIIEGLV